jgi:hypothetical protein
MGPGTGSTAAGPQGGHTSPTGGAGSSDGNHAAANGSGSGGGGGGCSHGGSHPLRTDLGLAIFGVLAVLFWRRRDTSARA